MRTCAYCNESRPLTREHLIPRFVYSSDIAKNAEWFCDRFPKKIDRTEAVIKDVCAECNNGPLAALDAFGKSLISTELPGRIFAGDTVQFSCDFDTLLRWLLKISYNSARIHNADIDILRRFTPYILGKGPAPEYVRLAMLGIAPTVYSGIRGHISATSQHHDDPTLNIPRCFRVTPFRMPETRTFANVQRTVIINSCAFIVLAVSPDDADATSQLESIQAELLSLDIGAKMVKLDAPSISLSPGSQNALTIQRSHVMNNPVTYGAMDGDWIKDRVEGKHGVLMFGFVREEVEGLEIEPFFDQMEFLLSSRQVSLAVRQRVEFFVDGYNEDARELWDIPEVRTFFRALHAGFQNWFFLARPEGTFLTVLINCICCSPSTDPKSRSLDAECLRRFYMTCFKSLNRLCHVHAIPEEVNREISDAALSIITRKGPLS